MTLLLLLLPLIILLGLSLIIPIIIVLKWYRRPILALVVALGIYLMPFISILAIAVLQEGGSPERPDSLVGLIGAIAILLVFGAPVLTIIQWKSRRNRKRRAQEKIDKAF